MTKRFWLACITISAAIGVFAQNVSTRIEPDVTSVRPGGEVDVVQLADEIETASAADRFTIDLKLNRLVQLGPLRDLLERQAVQRAIVTIPIGNNRGSIGIGTFYDRTRAWNYGVCRTIATASFSGIDAYNEIAPEEWWSNELMILASAYAIREILADPLLEGAEITSGSRSRMKNDERFARAVRRESEQIIETSANVSLPEFCGPFQGFTEAPVLTGNYVRPTSEEYQLGVEGLLRQQLTERSPNTPVTLNFQFREPQSLDRLGRFVEDYEIDGLYTNLSPTGNDRIAVMAELSIYGAGPTLQLQTVRCAIRASSNEPNEEWLATQASASVTVTKAWQLTTNQELYDIRLRSSFAPGNLARLEAYYDKKAVTGMVVPNTTIIPLGCENILSHSE